MRKKISKEDGMKLLHQFAEIAKNKGQLDDLAVINHTINAFTWKDFSEFLFSENERGQFVLSINEQD